MSVNTPGPTAQPRQEPMRWEIPVIDPHGRRRMLMIIISNRQVVMLGPPGEAWIVPPESDTQLWDALTAARRIARQLTEQASDPKPLISAD
jgi:hypothetical protein